MSDEGLIDLSPLDSPYGPRFQLTLPQNVLGSDSVQYGQILFNPCTPFNFGDPQCDAVAGCMFAPSISNSYNKPYIGLGFHNATSFKVNGRDVSLLLKGSTIWNPSSGSLGDWLMEIHMICD